jgi:rare lipoprotein A (peptidoglycan hydrolase)
MQSQLLRSITLAAAFALAAAGPALGQEPAPATGGVQATVGQPGLTVSPGALLDRTVTVRGQTEQGDAGRTVQLERQILDGSWQPIASAVVDPDGAFRATWKTDQLGRVALRASVQRDGAATAAAAPLTAQLTVFQSALASWYGPGFFGRRTACGTKLTRTTVGVAHRTLPCGTPVDIYYRGRILTVPVIDRGPFKKGRAWDLTQAAAEQLGVKATAKVGFLSASGLALTAPAAAK